MNQINTIYEEDEFDGGADINMSEIEAREQEEDRRKKVEEANEFSKLMRL
jgi:hypothetical protein